MTIIYSPLIQSEIDYILDYIFKFKNPPMEEYKDREILLTLAALNLEDASLQWSVQMDIVLPFQRSSTQPYYKSIEYLEKQLVILEDIDNIEDVISAIYDNKFGKTPRITVEQTNLLWLSGFLKYNKFIMPDVCNEVSYQAIRNFISFIDDNYEFVKTSCINNQDSLLAIEDFEMEAIQHTLTYVMNAELFVLLCSRLDPDRYSLSQNVNIVLNVYLHSKSIKEDPLVLLKNLFKHSTTMTSVIKPLDTMLKLGMQPFDYKDTSLVLKAFESLQTVLAEPLDEYKL